MKRLNTQINPENIGSFLYPPSCYSGNATSENVVFNHKLQVFAQEVAYISGLEASGQITTKAAYRQIRNLWKQLRGFKKQLKVSKSIGNLVSYHNGRKAV